MLGALAHGLDMIEFLAEAWGPGAVAAAIEMSKPGTHRILDTLALRGIVVRGTGSTRRGTDGCLVP